MQRFLFSLSFYILFVRPGTCHGVLLNMFCAREVKLTAINFMSIVFCGNFLFFLQSSPIVKKAVCHINLLIQCKVGSQIICM